MKEWERLMDSLEDFWLSEEADKFVWLLDKSGNYTTRSMYRRLTFRGADNKRMQKPWKSILPNKIEVFVWLVTQDRLQTGVNLKKKERRGDKNCCLCGIDETSDHICFHCHVARAIRFSFKEALGWGRTLQNIQDVFNIGSPYAWDVIGFTSIHTCWGGLRWRVRSSSTPIHPTHVIDANPTIS